MTETFVNALGEADPWAEIDDRPEIDTSGLLPEQFWQARDAFGRIRQAAHSQACSGDVLFWTCMCRLSAMISHQYRAVTGIGGRASLNLFAAVVGVSGAGKSTGASLARTLMPAPFEDFLDGLPVGTGEGIAEAFMGVVEEETGELHEKGPNRGEPVMARVRKQVRHNIFFYVDEGQTIAQLASRPGSTLSETIRRAAIGEALGQTNASEDRRRFIAPGSYSLGMLTGFQPSTAVPLLADASTGTPQRFFWAPAVDPAIPDAPVAWPKPFTFERHLVSKRPDGPVDVTFPERIRRELWAERVKRNRGEIEVAELDGHAGLMKVKLAALFAVLDNRLDASEEDWALAELVWASSCALRDSLVDRARRESDALRQFEADARIEIEVRAHEAKAEVDLAIERVAMAIRRSAAQVGGVSRGAARKALASRDRKYFEQALVLAISRGWVFEERDGEQICPVTDAKGWTGGH